MQFPEIIHGPNFQLIELEKSRLWTIPIAFPAAEEGNEDVTGSVHVHWPVHNLDVVLVFFECCVAAQANNHWQCFPSFALRVLLRIWFFYLKRSYPNYQHNACASGELVHTTLTLGTMPVTHDATPANSKPFGCNRNSNACSHRAYMYSKLEHTH